MSDKEIYFHVGTGKTGTTFLQYQVFPRLNGIRYIQRTRFKQAEKLIHVLDYPRYLISREFDQQLEEEVAKFARKFPDATPLIVFRKHGSYIASQFKRFVKNGFQGDFGSFFDLVDDSGYFKKKDLDYKGQIDILRKHFSKEPLVFVYEDLIENPAEYIVHMSQLLGCTIDISRVNLSRKHTSYSEHQLKAIQQVGRKINLRKRRVFKNGLLHLIWRLHLGAIRYSVLFGARFFAKTSFSPDPLIEPTDLSKIDQHFARDWSYVNSVAVRPSPELQVDRPVVAGGKACLLHRLHVCRMRM